MGKGCVLWLLGLRSGPRGVASLMAAGRIRVIQACFGMVANQGDPVRGGDGQAGESVGGRAEGRFHVCPRYRRAGSAQLGDSLGQVLFGHGRHGDASRGGPSMPSHGGPRSVNRPRPVWAPQVFVARFRAWLLQGTRRIVMTRAPLAGSGAYVASACRAAGVWAAQRRNRGYAASGRWRQGVWRPTQPEDAVTAGGRRSPACEFT